MEFPLGQSFARRLSVGGCCDSFRGILRTFVAFGGCSFGFPHPQLSSLPG